MDGCRVAIVIPALNESATINAIVKAVYVYGVPIVVDDGSQDGTAEIAVQAGAVVVVHERNHGYDSALNSGFEKAAELGAKIVITLDADGQHDPLIIRKFVDAINGGCDVVVGIRSRKQRFAEHVFAWYTRTRYGVKDPLCGMKAYRAEVYQALGHFDSYGSIGTELTLFAAKRNYRIGQIEFDVLNRTGPSRFGPVIAGNWKIICAMLRSI